MGNSEQTIEYRNLFESMEHGVIYQSSSGTILAMNSAAEKILNVSRDALTNTDAVDQHLNMVHEDLTPYPASDHPTMQALRTGEPVRDVVMGYWNTNDDDYRWVTVSAVPEFQNGESNPFRVFVTFTDITTQIRTEDLLRKSQERYQELFENISSCAAVYQAVNDGEDFIFLDFNKNAEKVDKIPRDQIIGKSVSEVFPGVVEFGLLDVFRRVWRTGESEQHPISEYRDNRITGWRENYVYKLPSGEIVAIYDDITDRKRIEEALLNSEKNFRNLMDDSPLGIRIVNEEGDTLYANQSMLDIYGYDSYEDLLDTPTIERYTTDSYSEHLDRKDKRQKGDYVSPHYTVSIIRKDGEIRYLEVFRKQVVWNDEALYQVICNDITPRKRAEEELILRSQLLDEATDGICLFNPEGEFLYVNEGFCKMHSCAKEDVIGQNIRQFSTTASDEFLVNLDEELKKSGSAVFEATHTLQDGTKLDLEVHSTEIIINDTSYNLSIERDITERKAVEDALYRSEQNFRNSIDNSPLGIIIKQDITSAVYCNQAVLDLFGYENLEELNATPVSERQFAETLPRLRDRWDVINKGDFTSARDSYHIRRTDGEVRFVEVFINRIVWNDTPHIQFIYHDVTERQRLDVERMALNGASKSVLTSTDFLSASKQIFEYCRKVTGAASGYIALLNEDTGNNDVVYLESGGLPCTVDPELPMPVRGMRSEAYRTGKTVVENNFMHTEWEKLMPAGHVRLENVLFAPLVVEDKAVGVIGLANKPSDFTESDIRVINSLAEITAIALVNSQYLELIQSNEEKYRMLFESVSDGFAVHEMIFDDAGNPADYRFLEMNPAFELQTGINRAEALGKRVTDVLPGIENDPADWIKVYGNVVKTGEPYRFEQYSESLQKYYSVLVFRSKPGQFATLFRDVTEFKLIEAERERAAKLESVGTLAGGIAHDFNNILTGILGNISLAKMDLDMHGETYKILDEAERASFRARDLTSQLLTFARGGEPVRKITKIDKLLQESVSFGARGSRTKPEFDIQNDLWALEVDEGQINQVILNIVNNAVEAMPGGGTLQVSAVNEEIDSGTNIPLDPGDYVKIRISDQGIGISSELVKRIFEPYFTTKQRGSGLGLATSYSIIKNHKGYITCESQPGQGTTFVMYLPALRDALIEEKETSVEPETGTGRILIMDDEEIIRVLLMRILTESGYTVEVSGDGIEAIEKYTEAMNSGEPFSAVILDLTVPGGLGGEETLAKLIELDPDVKAIVSSGYSTNAAMADYQKHGFVGMVAKPYKPGQVLKTLAEVLGDS